jgi:branched-chain amino acid transport system substrate-binding protein
MGSIVLVRKGRITAAIGLSGVLLLTACGSGDDDSGDSGSADSGGDAYQWGIDAELSGPLSFYGTSIAAGVQAYADQVNAEGGINGRQIEVTQLDSGGDQSRAAANATQLITADDVIAIFGNTLSTNCAAAQPIVERYKVPMACLSVAESSDYVFNLGPDIGRAAPALLDAAKEITGKDELTAAAMIPTTLTGGQLSDGLRDGAEDAGVDLATLEEFDITATDVSAQIASLVSANPDVIIASNTGPGFLTVLRGVRAAGLQVPIIWVDGTGNLASIADSTDANVYALTVHELVDPAAADGVAQEFVDAVSPTIDGTVDTVTLNSGDRGVGYATARAFGEALSACGDDCSGADLQAELQQTSVEMEGLVPTFAYSDDDHYPYANWLLYKVTGSTYEQVATYEAADK